MYLNLDSVVESFVGLNQSIFICRCLIGIGETLSPNPILRYVQVPKLRDANNPEPPSVQPSSPAHGFLHTLKHPTFSLILSVIAIDHH